MHTTKKTWHTHSITFVSSHTFIHFQISAVKSSEFQMYLYYQVLNSLTQRLLSERRMWKWKKRYVIQMVFFTLKRFWFQQSLKTCRSPNHHLQVTVGLLNIFFCHWWFIHPDKIDRLWANRCVKKVINGCRNSRRG